MPGTNGRWSCYIPFGSLLKGHNWQTGSAEPLNRLYGYKNFFSMYLRLYSSFKAFKMNYF